MRAGRETRYGHERGVALITTMLIMLLMSALMIGFTAAITSDQRYRIIDKDRGQAFYAAHSGLEKLNASLATLFFQNVAPTAQQIADLAEEPPVIPNVTFDDEGTDAYGVRYLGESSGQISTGPYEGLMALKRTYQLTSGAQTAAGGTVYLQRKVETVAIPVFQFGMFSEVDLSFSAADDFDFGGRVHTNGNLFLAQGGTTGSTLWLRDRVTAVGEIVRKRLSNGESITASGSTRIVKVARAPNTFRNLLDTEGSVLDGVSSSANPAWPTLSLSTYNAYMRTRKTGARRLDLPLITTGGATADLIRRPAVQEDTTNPTLLGERYFTKVSLRILLSDTANDILSLPTVTSTAPVRLDGDWIANPPNNGAAYGPVGPTRPPVARSPGNVTATVAANVTSGTNQTVQLTALPPQWQMPAFTLSNGVSSYQVTCNVKGSNSTQLLGCTATPAPLANVTWAGNTSTISTTIEGVPLSAPVTASLTISAGTGAIASLTVPNTIEFSPNTFWIENSNTLVTCRGYDRGANRLTGCKTPTLANGTDLRTNALSQAGTSTIGGFIKIERQDPSGQWTDVTMEILNWGFAGPNLSAAPNGKACADPTPNAIIRLQRLRDNNEEATWAGGCAYGALYKPTDYWPNVLFDAREAVYRDAVPAGAPSNLRLGGVIHYVALDVRNLSRWFAGTAPYVGSSGPNSITDNGFSVYFSDRRNNRNQVGQETGEYGFEDVVNPMSGAGTPNASLETGEDLNGNGVLDSYGQFPSYDGVANSVPPGAAAPLNGTARPWIGVDGGIARVNRPLFFRRALKLINGSFGNIVMPGLTISSENPVYVQGDWNANASGFVNGSSATSIVADAVTLLSNSWSDLASFNSPYDTTPRARSSHTWYRFAVIAGKGRIFPRPNNGEGATFGTDGGVHSFLRFLEGTGGSDTIHYMGSMATFFFNRQAVSPFKCCGGIVYDVPTRDYKFDVTFLNPSQLPPLTPVFRDLNALGFTQLFREEED